ncbi:MAG TPA: CDC48 family AAA ATPase [Methanoregulaceae archaeon]|nr:CDC48 family AAA ATPase [Methanoregulaceae archaeon]
MADTSNSINVTVKEAAREDAGRGIARVSMDAMRALGLVSGDVVEIQGKRKANAIVWPGFAEDTGRAIIRIDGSTRGNAGTGVDEQVQVRKVQAGVAKRVVIQPTQPIRLVGGEQYLKRLLLGRSVMEGQALRVDVIGNPLTFVIAKVAPKGIAIVSDETVVELKETPYEPKADEEKGERTDVHYEDIGGLGRELEQVREMIELPLRHPEIFERLGITPPKGVLLYGPPGTGKTLIAKAVANESGAHFIAIAGPEVISKYYGESEQRLREVFEEARENAPAIIFIDELDSIAPKREDVTGEVERRVVAQLLTMMDGLEERGEVVVIGATNRVDAIDPALRRPGRFDREIEIGVPAERDRIEILKIHTRAMPLGDDVDLEKIAQQTYGFVGADLAALAREAGIRALRRKLPDFDLEKDELSEEELEQLQVDPRDFRDALRDVGPSAMREVMLEVSHVTWTDVGGLDEAKEEVREAVEYPLTDHERFDQIGIRPPRGVLLYGPPGTGKTLLAAACSNMLDATFFNVKASDLLSKYFGESTKLISALYARARSEADVGASLIFIDEFESLCRKSSGDDSGAERRILSTFLAELDGLEEKGRATKVITIAATNHPWDISEPVLQRFEKQFLVDLPDEKSREVIFRIHIAGKGLDLAGDIDYASLARRTEGFSGRSIQHICKDAVETMVRDMNRDIADKVDGRSIADHTIKCRSLTAADFEGPLRKARPRMKPESLQRYRTWAQECGG